MKEKHQSQQIHPVIELLGIVAVIIITVVIIVSLLGVETGNEFSNIMSALNEGTHTAIPNQ